MSPALEHSRPHPGIASWEAAPVVFVVDDDISVRESLQSLLECVGCHVTTFSCAEEFLRHVPAPGPSCAVLDVSLPDLDGLALQERLAGERDDMPIVFITGRGDIPMTVRAMKSGAVDFITKPFADHVLLDAVRSGLDRSKAAQSRVAELRELRARHASLTTREREVMELVVTGLLNKVVGARLGISEITVKAHRGRVMEKMKAGSLPELVNMAARLGIASARS